MQLLSCIIFIVCLKCTLQASRIYLLSQHQPEATTFPEALRALRAYSLSEIPETVEVSLKMDMTLKKVGGASETHSFAPAVVEHFYFTM